MTNTTKWLIAIPFAAFVGYAIPALIAGDPAWFLGDWGKFVYAACSVGMWLAATAFVDVEAPRGRPDAANRLIPAGLLFSIPVSVADMVWGPAGTAPGGTLLPAVGFSAAAVLLGLRARAALGQAYSPRGEVREPTRLVRSGPYRWIRHPIYLAAILWCLGWPLFLRSLFGSLAALLFIIPALRTRIRQEERDLLRTFGDAYRSYQAESWHLLPYIY